MANEPIGRAPCPLCAKPARVTVSKARLAVLTCNGCNCQLFTRSDLSDEKLRGRLLAPPPAAGVVVELDENLRATVPAGTVISGVTLAPPPAAAPVANEEPQKKSTWDIWG